MCCNGYDIPQSAASKGPHHKQQKRGLNEEERSPHFFLSQGDFSRRKKRFVLGCPTWSCARPIKDEDENRRVGKDCHPSGEFAQEKSSRTNIMRLDSLIEQVKSISPVTPDKS